MIIPLIITLVVFVLTTHNQGLHLVLTLISLILPNFFLLSPFLGIILIYCYKGTCLTYFKLNSVKLTSYGVKTFSLLYSFFMFLLSLYLLVINDDTHGVSRITNQWPVSGTDTIYLNSLETRLAFSFDTFNLIFIVLTTFIISLCILRCFLWLPDSDLKLYLSCLFCILGFLNLAFSAFNLLYFYICFEGVLIPMYIVVGKWGSRARRIRASYLFFIYTFATSFLMFIGILYLWTTYGSQSLYFNSFTLHSNFNLSFSEQKILFILFFIALASKIPMFPFHIWLPEAHVEAPTEGSVILASLLLKLGGYGFLRFCLPMFPLACTYYRPFIFSLCIIGIFYSSLTAIRQVDLKRIIAYSSVAHMNVVVLGIFSLNFISIQGSVFLMCAHGITSGALFFLVGSLYDRGHSRLLKYYAGLVFVMPLWSTYLFLFLLANIAVPGTINFVGELLVLVGLFCENTFVGFCASLSCIFSAIYSLLIFNRICFGSLKVVALHDKINWNLHSIEFFIFTILYLINLLFGIFPNCILDLSSIFSSYLHNIYISL